MSNLAESERIKKAIERVADKRIDEQTKDCLRLYKAILINPANNGICGVSLIGDINIDGSNNVLNLPYSQLIEDLPVGSIVWIAVIFNSWANAIVWADAQLNVGGSNGNAKNAVLYIAQSLTDEQKAQARANIGAGTGDDKTYIHTQNISANTWKVNHNLGKYPSVTVVDSAGSSIAGAKISYDDFNNLTLTFSAIFSGKAYLN